MAKIERTEHSGNVDAGFDSMGADLPGTASTVADLAHASSESPAGSDVPSSTDCLSDRDLFILFQGLLGRPDEP